VTPALDRADELLDNALDHIRGNAVADRVFYTASQVGDFSIIWHVLNVGLVLLGVRTRKQAVRLALCLGAESLIVNQGIKRLFRRARPVSGEAHPHAVRTPSTSSFPSGHASSAAFAARLLSDDHPTLRPLFWLTATIVSLSRPYVRAHHASDIAGGLVTGSVLARGARWLWPR
jgi:membrane-associated phospholipid phosphatase